MTVWLHRLSLLRLGPGSRPGPVRQQLSQQGELAGCLCSPSPAQGVPGHHDTTRPALGCFVPAEPRTVATSAGFAEVPHCLPQRLLAGHSSLRGVQCEELSQKGGSGLAPLLMLGLRLFLPPNESCRVPGATLLCAEDKQCDACGPECALRPMANPQARCQQDSARISGGRRLQSRHDSCQAAWSHDPPSPQG